MRLDVDVDAYLPADYVPFEAAKIDVHRRIAGARGRASCARCATSCATASARVPEPVENLLALQRARIELGAAGARTAEVRGGRLSIDPARARRRGRRAPARARSRRRSTSSRTRTLSLRVADEPAERLEAMLALTEALADGALESAGGG